jgi:predicted RNA-binding protein YlxR (DUF448 family)
MRFVAGPDGQIVPDLKANLPGRGVWLKPQRAIVDEAVRRKAFSKGLKRPAEAPDDLGAQVDDLLVHFALGALGMARKAGQCLAGAGKVESALRNGSALAALHASDGAEDGLRKLRQWAHSGAEAAAYSDEDDKTSETTKEAVILRPFTLDQLSLALGANHVIHAAIMQGGAGRNALTRITQLVAYRDAGSG